MISIPLADFWPCLGRNNRTLWANTVGATDLLAAQALGECHNPKRTRPESAHGSSKQPPESVLPGTIEPLHQDTPTPVNIEEVYKNNDYNSGQK